MDNTKKYTLEGLKQLANESGFELWHIERTKVTNLAVGWYASEFYKLFVARYLGNFCSLLLRVFLL